MGNLEVIVPEGVEVDMEAGVALGSKTLRLESPPPPLEGPVVRITGLVLAGSVMVRDHPTFGERLSARLRDSRRGDSSGGERPTLR